MFFKESKEKEQIENLNKKREIAEQKTKEAVEKIEKRDILKEGFSRLEKELPKNLKYHNVDHARDVLHDAILFYIYDGKSSEIEIMLLGIAAVYHDSGFIEKFSANEEIGARFAKEAMQ